MEHSDVSSDVNDATLSGDVRDTEHPVEHRDVGGEMDDATKRRDWREVGHLMERGQLREEQRSQVVEEASQRAEEQDLTAFILPVLTEGELLRVLQTLFTRRCWSAVGKVLDRNVSNTLNMNILTETLDLGDDRIFGECILPRCDSDQVDMFMTHLVTTRQWWLVKRLLHSMRRLKWTVEDVSLDRKALQAIAEKHWQSLSDILKNDVNDLQRKWIIDVACKQADDLNTTRYILPRCADDQLGSVLATLVTRGLWRSVGVVLHRGVSPSQRRWAINEACQQAGDWGIRDCILPHCANDMLDDVLTTVVARGMWQSVCRLFDLGASATRCTWAIQEALQNADDLDIRHHILSQCADDQLSDALTTLVKRGLWQSADTVLHRGVSPALHRWAVHEALQHGDDVNIRDHILTHFDGDRIDDVLTTLVTRGLWRSVDTVLRRGVSPAQHIWAIHEACTQAPDRIITDYILPHCADDQLDTVLTSLVSRGLWRSVDTVLYRGVNQAHHRWAIHEACQQTDEQDVTYHTLHHCDDDQLDEVVTTLMIRGLLQPTLYLNLGGRPDQLFPARSEADHQVVDQYIKDHVLSHCVDNQLDGVLTTLVTLHLWRSVGGVLHRVVSPTKHRWAMYEACQHADEEDFIQFMLPHFSDDLLDDILTTLVIRGLWRSVGKVFLHLGGISCSTWPFRRESVHQVTDQYIRDYVLPHCVDNQLGDVLTSLVAQGYWRSVDRVLDRTVNPAKHNWAILEASKHAEDEDITIYILPHCANDQLDDVVTTLVAKGVWRSVHAALNRGVSPAKHTWAIHEAAKRANDQIFTKYVLPCCADDVLDCILTVLATKGLWESVDRVLHRGVSPAQHRWAVHEACQHANDEDIKLYILPHCTDDQLDDVVTTLVIRGLWESVCRLLERGVSPTLKGRAIREACHHVNDRNIRDYILPNCADDYLDDALTTLVTRGLWVNVDRVLHHAVSPAKHRWAVHEACQHANDEDIKLYILPHCTDDQLDDVCTTLLIQGLWESVCRLLERGVSPTLKGRAIREACHHVNDRNIRDYILPNCADDYLDDALSAFVTRCLWEFVDRVLHRAVSPAKHRWAVHEACQHANDEDIKLYILPHCTDDQLDDVLTTLVTRGLWVNVDRVLHRAVSPAKHRWAVHEACQHANDEDIKLYILPHCTDDQPDDVLTTLVTRGLWVNVDRVLHRAVSPAKHRWAVHEACQHANDEDIKLYILPHCTDDQLDDVVTTLVIRGLWQSLGKVFLQLGGIPHQWIKKPESGQQVMDQDIRDNILPHCLDNRLDDIMTILVAKGFWRSVDKVLDRGISSAVHRWATHEACQHANDQIFTKHILSHCGDDQLDCILTTLVTRGLWRSVDRVLHRIVSPAQHRRTIQKACQKAEDRAITEYILSHCAINQLDDVLTSVVKRGLWWSVSHVLERDVSLLQHRWAVREVLKSGNDLLITGCMLPGFRPKQLWKSYLQSGHVSLTTKRSAQLWGWIAKKLSSSLCGSLCNWARTDIRTEPSDATLWRYMVNPRYKAKDLSKLMMALRPLRQKCEEILSHRLDWDPALCAVLYESVVHFVTETWVSELQHDTQRPAGQLDEEARLLTTQIQEHMLEGQSRSTPHISHTLRAVRNLCSADTADTDRRSPVFGLYFIKNLTQQCYRRRQSTASTDVIFHVLACVPVVPDVQSVALTVMLRHKRWDVIRRADLCGVWEQVRRRLLTAAIKQEQWSLVAQWANYTLYDDQCLDALEEAYTHKQWRVYLLLADHGPMELDLMRVHYRLTRYAPWDVVLEMFERGADLIECQEGVRPGKNLRILDQKKDDNERRPRYVKLLLLQEEWEERMVELGSLKAALEKQEWSVALHEINRRHRREEIVLALRAALTSKVWHVVIYLIRQGNGTRLCDGLFSLMVEMQQWDVCRVLLEEGVDLQLGLDALPQLMEQNQWTLVARLMEYDVGDALRRQVMQQALDRREGSVVWQCIINMEHDHLSVEERQELFHEAFNRENWQAVKPLVEVEDDTGIQHRDAALLESIEQHQWDVVDHCLLFRANINMLDEDGHTPNHRMARKKDWEAVEEVTKRGGDPNLLDKEGLSVFHRVILARQWELAKLLIKFHGDIHQQAEWSYKERRTPLQMLIDARQMDVIKETFMWCPDQGEGVNGVGETTLHAACLTGCDTMMYDLLARRVDPLAVTKDGFSAMSYAVVCGKRPQQSVACCVSFGFSTHQPHLTDAAMDKDEKRKGAYRYAPKASSLRRYTIRERAHTQSLLTSPLLLAVMRGLPVVVRMLFESGVCSYRELFRLKTNLMELLNAKPEEETVLERVFQEILDTIHKHPNSWSFEYASEDMPEKPDRDSVQQCARYVMEVSTTPRSLQSLCSHVITHCIKLHKNYAEDVNELPLVGAMKRCVALCDLTEPDYGQDDVYRQRREEFVSRRLSEALSLLAEGDGAGVKIDKGPQGDTGTQRGEEEEEEDHAGGEGPSVETDKGPHVDTGTQREEEGHTADDSDEDEEDDDSEVDSDEHSYNIYDSDAESDEEDDSD